MGNTSKKLAAKCTLLTKEEQKYVAATFRAASKNSERIREDDLIVSGKVDAVLLEKFWGPQIDPRLAQYLSNFLFGSGQQKTPSVDFNRFAELYVYNVRGTVDERLIVTYNSLGKDYNETVELPYQLLREYCESIASTYIKIVKASSSRRARTWIEKGFRGRASHVQALGEAVAASVGGDLDSPHHHCTADQLSKWLQTNILLKQLAELVFVHLYGINKRGGDESPAPLPPAPPSLLPLPDGRRSGRDARLPGVHRPVAHRVDQQLPPAEAPAQMAVPLLLAHSRRVLLHHGRPHPRPGRVDPHNRGQQRAHIRRLRVRALGLQPHVHGRRRRVPVRAGAQDARVPRHRLQRPLPVPEPSHEDVAQRADNGWSVRVLRHLGERGAVRRGRLRGVLQHVPRLPAPLQGGLLPHPQPRGLGRGRPPRGAQGRGRARRQHPGHQPRGQGDPGHGGQDPPQRGHPRAAAVIMPPPVPRRSPTAVVTDRPYRPS